jgi:hypothetical protein
MARSIITIQNQIIASIRGETSLYDPTNPDPSKRGLTSTSRVAIWRLITFVVAAAIAFFEQLLDVFKAGVEAQVLLSPPGTPLWVQTQIFKFQYSSTDPQIIQLDTTTLSPFYPTLNTALRIVTQCSVTTSPNKVVIIKVASNSTPLTSDQQLALSAYLDFLNFAGVYFQLISTDPDLIMAGYDIYFNGMYAAYIQTDVEDAITNFLSTSNANNFNGSYSLSKLEDIIQAVPGVNDVVARQVEVRPAAIIAANAYKMVDNYQTLLRKYDTYAGYMIVDTDSGRTLADTLTFIVS